MLCEAWLSAISSTVAANTCNTYRYYWAHWRKAFETAEGITKTSISQYQRDRLGKVVKMTVRKESSALRQMISWLFDNEAIDELVEVPALPKKSTGKRANEGRKVRATELSPAQVEAVIAALPEWSAGGNGRHKNKPRFAVRARFIVAYETGLRPSTLDRLEVPTHYRKGLDTITIDDEDDKSRFGRVLPLTQAARDALDSVCPREGAIFGVHDFRDYLERAAKEALPRELVDNFSAYDFRHARGTHLLEATGDLLGVGYLLGHRHATTTNRYAHASRRAGESVLRAAERAVTADSGVRSGVRPEGKDGAEVPDTGETSCAKGGT